MLCLLLPLTWATVNCLKIETAYNPLISYLFLVICQFQWAKVSKSALLTLMSLEPTWRRSNACSDSSSMEQDLESVSTKLSGAPRRRAHWSSELQVEEQLRPQGLSTEGDRAGPNCSSALCFMWPGLGARWLEYSLGFAASHTITYISPGCLQAQFTSLTKV